MSFAFPHLLKKPISIKLFISWLNKIASTALSLGNLSTEQA
ncbi:hypothetical protein HMPREF1985_00047 [Mitsuokella sp. oral taxon 131 str. W9106]|nr:hypothetical protein HMPREF1985_00047 [Mitsuokella sp. oral taxon 131 str. W9106]